MEMDTKPKRQLEREIEMELGDDYVLDLKSMLYFQLRLNIFRMQSEFARIACVWDKMIEECTQCRAVSQWNIVVHCYNSCV